MWLRSQNGEELINSSRITIESDFNNCYYNENYKKISGKHWFIRADIVVGAYSTKEKAMKVMDLIQRQIVSRSESYEIVRPVLKSDPFEPYWKKREVVFQMPKDEDIE